MHIRLLLNMLYCMCFKQVELLCGKARLLFIGVILLGYTYSSYSTA